MQVMFRDIMIVVPTFTVEIFTAPELYRSGRKKNLKFKKRKQNEDENLNFHLHNTL